MDKNKVAMIAVGAGIAGLLIGLAINSFHHGGRGYDMQGWDDDRGGMMDRRNDDRADKNSNNTGDNMMGMDHSNVGNGGMMDNMMVASEREFIMGMIPHHEEAIATAKQVLERGGSTQEIKTLAENIVRAQEAEVAQMKEWYKNWYGADYVADGKYKLMMRPLEVLSGAELDKVFLSDMIMHHKMAIMMANSVDAHIEHDEMKTLSNNIKTTQSAEIETMQNLLMTLN
jgi:uncharacterized protein (DUF305 family)